MMTMNDAEARVLALQARHRARRASRGNSKIFPGDLLRPSRARRCDNSWYDVVRVENKVAWMVDPAKNAYQKEDTLLVIVVDNNPDALLLFVSRTSQLIWTWGNNFVKIHENDETSP